MPLKESEAIVLRSYPLGEGDRLVSFLDRESGRVRGVARGARLPKSRFGSTLELLSHIRIWYFERETRELVRINQCELLESFLDVQCDYQAAVTLALVSEVTEAILGEREPADRQFRLVLAIARAVRKYGPSPIVLAYFSLWTVRLAGWLGTFDYCSRCGRSLEGGPAYASVGTSGFVCPECRRGGMREVSLAALSLAKQIVSGPLEQVMKKKQPDGAATQLYSYTLDLIEHHLEKKLVARQMLEVREGSRIEI
jgi:DNA repair protein RecO (recombination protein O)